MYADRKLQNKLINAANSINEKTENKTELETEGEEIARKLTGLEINYIDSTKYNFMGGHENRHAYRKTTLKKIETQTQTHPDKEPELVKKWITSHPIFYNMSWLSDKERYENMKEFFEIHLLDIHKDLKISLDGMEEWTFKSNYLPYYVRDFNWYDLSDKDNMSKYNFPLIFDAEKTSPIKKGPAEGKEILSIKTDIDSNDYESYYLTVKLNYMGHARWNRNRTYGLTS